MSMENCCIDKGNMDNRNMNNRTMDMRKLNNRPFNNLDATNRDCNVIKTRAELDHAITKVSFSMDDTRLFLDTHPNCMEALEYFKKLQLIRHGLIKEYTERFGTIYSYNMGDCDNWNWNCGEYPWTSHKKGWC